MRYFLSLCFGLTLATSSWGLDIKESVFLKNIDNCFGDLAASIAKNWVDQPSATCSTSKLLEVEDIEDEYTYIMMAKNCTIDQQPEIKICLGSCSDDSSHSNLTIVIDHPEAPLYVDPFDLDFTTHTGIDPDRFGNWTDYVFTNVNLNFATDEQWPMFLRNEYTSATTAFQIDKIKALEFYQCINRTNIN